MKKILFGVLCLVFTLGYANTVLDEGSSQAVITSSIDPVTQALIERMDNAKANGNMELFNELLIEYMKLNPAKVYDNGPQGIVYGPEPEPGQGGNNMDWTNDVVIDSAWEFPTVSMDSWSDGWVFVAAEKDSTSSSQYDVIPIWYSTTGDSWVLYYTIFWAGHNCRNPSCKVVETSSADYLYVMFDGRQDSSPYETDVWVLVHEFGTSDWIYHAVSNVSGIDEADPSMDADDYQYASGVYLYCAFESQDSIAVMRSLDYGVTWTSRQIIANGSSSWDYLDPDLAYGWYDAADSFTVGVAWQYNQSDGAQRLRFRANWSYASSGNWLDIEYFTSPTNHLDNNPKLKMTHDDMPSGTILFARRDTVGTDEEDLCNFYTYNGGRDWTDDTLYSGGTYDVLIGLANDRTANDYHAIFRGDANTIRYKEAHYDDLSYGGWSYSIGINDAGQTMSNYTNPAAAQLNDLACGVWKDVTNSTWYKLMFDAVWRTGVEETEGTATAGFVSLAPSITRGSSKLSYIVSESGTVKITMFDATGRLVKTFVNGKQNAGEYTLTLNENLASGVYFIKVETPTRSASTTMTIIK
jgi:hypothetical protein